MRLAFLAVLLLPLSAQAAAPRLPEQPTRENILGWINLYRSHRDPERLPVAIRGMSRLGLLTDPEGSGVYVGFIAGVLASNPDTADELIASIDSHPEDLTLATKR